MKFYESTLSEYVNEVKRNNLHEKLFIDIPEKIEQLTNTIFYGPSGSGKYSQVLYLLSLFSPTNLKFQKYISFQKDGKSIKDKNKFSYLMSDVHFEIDMNLLGCNSKSLWHDIYLQIIDIVMIRPNKTCIILCKNFHMCNNELLEIFYSYMQKIKTTNIKIIYFIITEQISFIPQNIIMNFNIVNIPKCSINKINNTFLNDTVSTTDGAATTTPNAFFPFKKKNIIKKDKKINKVSLSILKKKNNGDNNAENDIYSAQINNLKIYKNKNRSNIPDIFNTICNNIIELIKNKKNLIITEFRDVLYNILIYNLDVAECVWFIFTHFIRLNYFNNERILFILDKITIFLKRFNNNYRPISHLESIFILFIMEGEQGEEKEDGRERGCAESETQLKNHIFHACTHKNEYKI